MNFAFLLQRLGIGAVIILFEYQQLHVGLAPTDCHMGSKLETLVLSVTSSLYSLSYWFK